MRRLRGALTLTALLLVFAVPASAGTVNLREEGVSQGYPFALNFVGCSTVSVSAGIGTVDLSGCGVPGGSGDITSVGDVATGAAFDGTQGTTLTFFNGGGNKTLSYNGTAFAFTAPLSVDASDPADSGALRLDNNEAVAWEANPTGVDITFLANASNVLAASVPLSATTGFQIGGVATDDNVLLGNGTNYVASAVPNCTDSGGNHLNYATAGNAFSCGTSVASHTHTFTLAGDSGSDIVNVSGGTETVAGGAGIVTSEAAGTVTVALKYTDTLAGNPTMNAGEARFGTTGLLFEGATNDTIEGLLTVADPTVSDKTWTLPDLNGTVALTANKLSVFAATSSSELASVISDETGTAGKLVFDTTPVFQTNITTPVLISAAADPADGGAIRLGNAELVEWEKAVAGTDWTLGVNSSDILASSAPIQFATYTRSDNADVADAGAVRLGNAENIAWEANPTGTDLTLGVNASNVLVASGAFTSTGNLTASAHTVFEGVTSTGATGTGKLVYDGAPTVDSLTTTTFLKVPTGASPTVDAAGKIAEDTTDEQLLIGATPSVIPTTYQASVHYDNLVDADDNQLIWTANKAVHVTGVGCVDSGFTTHPIIALEDDSGNAMTHATLTCSATTPTTFIAVTAANTLVAGESLRFDNTQTSTAPITGTQAIITFTYTVDRS